MKHTVSCLKHTPTLTAWGAERVLPCTVQNDTVPAISSSDLGNGERKVSGIQIKKVLTQLRGHKKNTSALKQSVQTWWEGVDVMAIGTWRRVREEQQ